MRAMIFTNTILYYARKLSYASLSFSGPLVLEKVLKFKS
jgi:hypothetical protein